jgi:ribosomal-protein-alanine N-acetyltransferase
LAPQKKRGGNAVNIRPAAREDMDALFALDRVCFRAGIAYSRAELGYFVFHPRSVSIVAEDEGGIAGFAVVEFLLERGRLIGHIVTIDVAPALRRRGVGRTLMEALLGFCHERQAAIMRLEVAVDNDGAIAFYKLLDFVETGRIRGFYVGGLDALRMEKDLPSGHTSFAPS